MWAKVVQFVYKIHDALHNDKVIQMSKKNISFKLDLHGLWLAWLFHNNGNFQKFQWCTFYKLLRTISAAALLAFFMLEATPRPEAIPLTIRRYLLAREKKAD